MSRIPQSIKVSYRQILMRLRFDHPDRTIIESAVKFAPAPSVESASRQKALKPIWTIDYTDDGRTIRVGTYRELYDDRKNGITELSDWYRKFGCVRRERRKVEHRWQKYPPIERLSPEQEAHKRKEMARKLFPLVRKPIRKLLFSEEVQRDLSLTIDQLTKEAIRTRVINDCHADREDYQRALQYACWALASQYNPDREGNDGRTSASLTTFIRDILPSKAVDMRRTRFALKSLGNLFTIPLESDLDDEGEYLDAEDFVLKLVEGDADSRRSVPRYEVDMDIAALREFLASPAGVRHEKAFNLLVLDGLDRRTAAERLGIPYETFRYRHLEPLRKICRKFGFAPKSERKEVQK